MSRVGRDRHGCIPPMVALGDRGRLPQDTFLPKPCPWAAVLEPGIIVPHPRRASSCCCPQDPPRKPGETAQSAAHGGCSGGCPKSFSSIAGLSMRLWPEPQPRCVTHHVLSVASIVHSLTITCLGVTRRFIGSSSFIFETSCDIVGEDSCASWSCDRLRFTWYHEPAAS